MELKNIISKMKSMQTNMKENKVNDIALENLLKQGIKSTDETQANQFWSSVRALVKAMGHEGLMPSRSTLPESVQQSISTAVDDVIEASINFYNHGIVGSVIFRHGKSGGGTFANAEDYAKTMAQITGGKLREHYKSKAWDGKLPVNVNTETLQVAQSETAVTEATE